MRYFIVILMLFSLYAFSEPIDTAEAKQIAINFFRYKNPTRNLTEIRQTNITQYKGITTRYNFIMEDNSFVVVSADNSTDPILAYSDYGVYSEDNSPSFELWMQSEYDELVVYNKLNNFSNQMTIQKWNDIKNNSFSKNKSINSVAPLIKTRWGQSCPNDNNEEAAYNYFVQNNTSCNTKKCATRCVSTAMAQIMNYWRSNNNNFDWCNMQNELVTTNLNYNAQRDAIALLMADCGSKADVSYCSNGCLSSSTIGKGKIAFENDYNYSNDMLHRYRWLTINWKPKMRNSLNNGQPIFYGGNEPNGGSGHAFVCDGYQDDNYFHFNWGWRGSNDGYFYIRDNDGDHIIDYNKWQEAVFYLHPENPNTVNCIDCIENIVISNVVTANNPYNLDFYYIKWYGIPPIYNYLHLFPFSANKPYFSEILSVNDSLRLEYKDIVAGNICKRCCHSR